MAKKQISFDKLKDDKKGLGSLFTSNPAKQQASKKAKQPTPQAEQAPDLIKVTFYLDPDVSKQLGILAIEKGSNKSALTNEALKTLLKKNGKDV